MMQLGRRVYGLSAIALGAVGLAFGAFANIWQPFPDTAPARPMFALAVAGLYVVGGFALQVRRTAPIGALTCAALGLMFAFFWFSMRLVSAPQAYVMYNGVAEQLAFAVAGVALFASLSEAGWAPHVALVARVLFGACCVVFGGAHFAYVTETAAMVPSYMPFGGPLWAQITGACHAAAGVAIITGILAPIAARLLTAMYLGFGALVWAPMLLAAAPSPDALHTTWAGNAINFGLAAAAWVIADVVAAQQKRA